MNNRKQFIIADFCCPALVLIIKDSGSVHQIQKVHDNINSQLPESKNYTPSVI